MQYIISRNAKKRPTLMHAINPHDISLTLCGINLKGWSRVYFKAPIEPLLCLTCKKVTHG